MNRKDAVRFFSIILTTILKEIIRSQLLILITGKISFDRKLSRESKCFQLKRGGEVSSTVRRNTCDFYPFDGCPLFLAHTYNLRTRRNGLPIIVFAFTFRTAKQLQKYPRILSDQLGERWVRCGELLDQGLDQSRVLGDHFSQLSELRTIAKRGEVDGRSLSTLPDRYGSLMLLLLLLLLLLSELKRSR